MIIQFNETHVRELLEGGGQWLGNGIGGAIRRAATGEINMRHPILKY